MDDLDIVEGISLKKLDELGDEYIIETDLPKRIRNGDFSHLQMSHILDRSCSPLIFRPYVAMAIDDEETFDEEVYSDLIYEAYGSQDSYTELHVLTETDFFDDQNEILEETIVKRHEEMIFNADALFLLRHRLKYSSKFLDSLRTFKPKPHQEEDVKIIKKVYNIE